MVNEAFIIDDDPICHFLTRHLIIGGNLARKVTCFLEAEEAMRQLIAGFPDNGPDIIFLDLNMPEMNGWQLLEALRPYEVRFRSKTKIFILTSSVDAADQEKAREYPFVSGYFFKPLKPTDLEAIRHLLNGESQ